MVTLVRRAPIQPSCHKLPSAVLDQDRRGSSRAVLHAPTGDHHRKRSDATPRTDEHQPLRGVHRVVNRLLISWRNFSVDTPGALEICNTSAAMRVHVFPDLLLAPAARPKHIGMLPAEYDGARSSVHDRNRTEE